MKKILLLVVVCCSFVVAQAQRMYFFYLQSDNKAPFYLKTGDKVYSSTAQGYLIVPRLVDSTYNVVIGKAGVPEVRFTIAVNQKDRGFLLREAGQKLSLFDLQSMAVIEPAPTGEGSVSYQQKSDRFTRLLAQAADDTTLLYVAVVPKVEKPATPVNAVNKETTPQTATAKSTEQVTEKDTTTIAQTAEPIKTNDTTAIVAQAVKEPAKEKEAVAKAEEVITKTEMATAAAAQPEPKEPVAEEKEFKRSVIVRRAESSTSEGFGLIFTDSADGVVDTIRLVIPNPKVAYAVNENAVKEAAEDTQLLQPQKVAAVIEAEGEGESKKRRGLFGNKKEPAAEEESTVKNNQKEKETFVADATKNADCSNAASNNDFNKLRRNMVGKSSEAEMIAEAQKYFRNKCFTTQQIKTLSSLLLTSNGRYRLFEAAQNHVSDKQNFKSLQNELWDREDINRFKALLAL